MQQKPIHIAILASGSGSNAEQITKHLAGNDQLLVKVIASNKKDAYVLERAVRLGVDHFTFTSTEMREGLLEQKLKDAEIDFIVLAGFLLKIPQSFIEAFPNRIINIHPALLPKYGGKGMYGMHVHKAVKENCEDESGITIHFVNEHYDEGQIIFQAKTQIEEKDTPEDIAQKIHLLEYNHFPRIVEEVTMKAGKI